MVVIGDEGGLMKMMVIGERVRGDGDRRQEEVIEVMVIGDREGDDGGDGDRGQRRR